MLLRHDGLIIEMDGDRKKNLDNFFLQYYHRSINYLWYLTQTENYIYFSKTESSISRYKVLKIQTLSTKICINISGVIFWWLQVCPCEILWLHVSCAGKCHWTQIQAATCSNFSPAQTERVENNHFDKRVKTNPKIHWIFYVIFFISLGLDLILCSNEQCKFFILTSNTSGIDVL